MKTKGRKIVCILIVLGFLLTAIETRVEAQVLKDYETNITDIIRCNDRSGFDTGIITAVAAVIRIRLLFFIVLMLMGVAIVNNNGTILKLIMFCLIGYAGVGITYEKLVISHIESAKNFSATMRTKAVSTSSANGVVITGNSGGTNISNPPSANAGYVVLPPPPPLDGNPEAGTPGYNPSSASYPACN